jgi:hypothetical protein
VRFAPSCQISTNHGSAIPFDNLITGDRRAESPSNSGCARNGRNDFADRFGGLHDDRRRNNFVLEAIRPAGIHPDQ